MEILPFETEYSFLKVSNNKEIIQTIKQNQTSISNIALLNGGFEYKISPRFTVQTEGFYYKDIIWICREWCLRPVYGQAGRGTIPLPDFNPLHGVRMPLATDYRLNETASREANRSSSNEDVITDELLTR